ncbi:MAPK regulated corepressor interacting protein 2 [Pogona vitticeps]
MPRLLPRRLAGHCNCRTLRDKVVHASCRTKGPPPPCLLTCKFWPPPRLDLPAGQPGRREHMIMYTITKGPSKLVTQRRTGPTQQVESKLADLKCRRQQHHQQQQQPPHPSPHPGQSPSAQHSHPILAGPLSSPAPKLVFNRINGKRPPLMPFPMSTTEESYTAAHEENVRFVHEAWQQVEQQLNDSQPGDKTSGPVSYVEKSLCPELKNFVPIDLDDWWAQQFLAGLENGS